LKKNFHKPKLLQKDQGFSLEMTILDKKTITSF
jgi:hypothetical protein